MGEVIDWSLRLCQEQVIFPCIFPVIRELFGDGLADDWFHRHIKKAPCIGGFFYMAESADLVRTLRSKTSSGTIFHERSEPEGPSPWMDLAFPHSQVSRTSNCRLLYKSETRFNMNPTNNNPKKQKANIDNLIQSHQNTRLPNKRP